MGRPTKLTKETIKRLVAAIRKGATYELACGYAGVGYSTFREWMIKGEDADEGEFLEFLEAIKKAEADAAVGWLDQIEKAAKGGNWQAAAWKLERRYPREYGRNVTTHEIKNIDMSQLSDKQLARLAAGEDPALVLRDEE